MKNKEKHIDLLVECVTHNYCSEKLLDLVGIDCDLQTSCGSCRRKIKKWMNKEYVEPIVDWSKVPIDTKVQIRTQGSVKWFNRHFAGLRGGQCCVYVEGKTSFTSNCNTISRDIEDIRLYQK